MCYFSEDITFLLYWQQTGSVQCYLLVAALKKMASELQAFASVAPTITQPENTSSGELGGRGDETHTYTYIYIYKYIF